MPLTEKRCINGRILSLQVFRMAFVLSYQAEEKADHVFNFIKNRFPSAYRISDSKYAHYSIDRYTFGFKNESERNQFILLVSPFSNDGWTEFVRLF